MLIVVIIKTRFICDCEHKYTSILIEYYYQLIFLKQA
jgi:hypothetical protein